MASIWSRFQKIGKEEEMKVYEPKCCGVLIIPIDCVGYRSQMHENQMCLYSITRFKMRIQAFRIRRKNRVYDRIENLRLSGWPMGEMTVEERPKTQTHFEGGRVEEEWKCVGKTKWKPNP